MNLLNSPAVPQSFKQTENTTIPGGLDPFNK